MILLLPSSARLGFTRLGITTAGLGCEHWRWISEVSAAKLPVPLSALFAGAQPEGTWGELMTKCWDVAWPQLVWVCQHNAADVYLFLNAIVGTVTFPYIVFAGLRRGKAG